MGREGRFGGYLQVVDIGVEQLDVFKHTSLGVLEVQGRDPVVAVITVDLGIGALGLHEILTSSRNTEVAASKDVVNMSASGAGVDDRISTSNGELLVVEVEDGKGAFVLGSNGCTRESRKGSGGSELHRYFFFWNDFSLGQEFQCSFLLEFFGR